MNITDYITEQDKVTGAYGFDVNEKIAYIFSAKAVFMCDRRSGRTLPPEQSGIFKTQDVVSAV